MDDLVYRVSVEFAVVVDHVVHVDALGVFAILFAQTLELLLNCLITPFNGHT